jgi:phosphotransferase system HPr-like phosphotransfer protein
MGLMMLAAGPGSILKIEISGKDATRAMEQISALLERKFDED